MKRFYCCRILYVLLCLIFCAALQAQSTYTFVIKGAQEKDVYTPVLVLEHETGPVEILMADSTATFTCSTVDLRRYKLHFSAAGYQDKTIAGENITHHYNIVVLDPVTEIAFEVVTVTGTQKPVLKREGSKFILNHVSNSPFAQGQSAIFLMRFLPLLRVDSQDNLSILGRGRPEIHINGRQTQMDQTAVDAYLKALPAAEIERIEIIPSPGSRYGGSAGNGIINIVIKKRKNDGYSLYLSSQGAVARELQMEQVSLFLNSTINRIDVTAGVIGQINYADKKANEWTEIFETDARIHSYNREQNLSKYTMGNLNMDYNINKQHIIGVRINGGVYDPWSKISQRVGYFTGSVSDSIQSGIFRTEQPKVPISMGTNLNYNFKTDEKGSLFSIDLNYVFNSQDKTMTGNYLTERPDGCRKSSGYLQHPENKVYGFSLKSDYTLVLGDDNKLGFGVSQVFPRLKSDLSHTAFREQTVDAGSSYLSAFKYKENRTGVYAEYDRQWSESIDTEVGIRYEYRTLEGNQRASDGMLRRHFSEFLPSLAVNWQINDDHQLAFDFSKRLYFPDYNEYNNFRIQTTANTISVNNPDLKPMKSYSGSLYYSLFSNYTLSLDYSYHKDGYSSYTFPVGNNLFYTQNINDSQNHSVSVGLDANQSFLQDFLHLRAYADGSYEKYKNKSSDMILSQLESWEYSVGLTAMCYFSAAQKVSLTVDWEYRSAMKTLHSRWPRKHHLMVMLNMNFRNSSLQIAVQNLVMSDFKQTVLTKEYFSRRLQKSSPMGHISYTHRFGSDKIRSVQERSVSEINSKL